MQGKRLYPVVEIVRPSAMRFGRKRKASTPSPHPPEAERHSQSLSTRKRRRDAFLNDEIVDAELTKDFSQVALHSIGQSPTASDYNVDPPNVAYRQPSPTASDWESDLRDPTTDFPDNMRDGLYGNPDETSCSKIEAAEWADDSDPATFIYDCADNEIEENEDIAIYGESLPDDLSVSPEGGGEREEDDEVPVRLLNDFAIYDLSSKEAVSFSCLQQIDFSRQQFGASGIVQSWTDQDTSLFEDDNESESGSEMRNSSPSDSRERVTLTRVLEFNVHHFSERIRCLPRLDGKIYIRTKFAWYILGIPSTRYTPFFTPFWKQHRITHLVLTASLENLSITYARFCDNLDELDRFDDQVSVAHDILGRAFSEMDLNLPEVRAYVVAIVLDLQKSLGISRVPLIKDFLASPSQNVISKSHDKNRKRGGANLEREVFKQKNITFTTPIVGQIARGLFETKLEVASVAPYHDENSMMSVDRFRQHDHDPRQIEWGGRTVPGKEFYEDVIIDGIIYKINDVVMVEPEENVPKKHIKTVNEFGNHWWFCQIRYFFETENQRGQTTKMFHAQWLTHGSRTVLQELSHSRALYLLNSCDDNPINCIYKKCAFRILKEGDDEVPDDFEPRANDFHCALAYNEEQAEFTDIPAEYYTCLGSVKSCFSCDRKEELQKNAQIELIPNGFSQHGTNYHLHDFVYIIPPGDSKLFDIAQIIRIRSDSPKFVIFVRRLKRYDDYLIARKSKNFAQICDAAFVSDDRRLVLTKVIEKIGPSQLNGICYVQYLTNSKKIEGWVRHDDHFYLNQLEAEHKPEPLNEELMFCETCYAVRQKAIRQDKRFRQLNSKLVGMELFSGAGGLSLGIDLSDYVETRYAVELSRSAALTYERNHPNTRVYCQDSSILLKHAVAKENGENPGRLLSKDDKTNCPEMPTRRDKIDFIFGGPPCQSFSRVNYNRKSDDFRSTLPCNMLGFVEHYDPDYFLLENVGGLVDHKLKDNRFSNEGVVIEYGMVKFILRTLIALGYQARYKLLQAGQYGAPQSRHRVIFWGAKRGMQLPEFPVPMYAFQRVSRTSLPSGEKMPPPTRCKIPGEYHLCAPLRSITVFDAIGDLPPFEWKNPRCIWRGRQCDEQARTWFGVAIPEVDACHDKGQNEVVGYPEGGSYVTAPQNRYQRWIRHGMKDEHGDEKVVQTHYTRKFCSKHVEAVTTVPIHPQANHKDLPLVLQPDHAKPGAKQEKYSFYGRIDGTQHFKCVLTQLLPTLKNSWPLHPQQRRMITVREYARAQGFPDHYLFLSINKNPSKIAQDQIRQIGNAVAIPFALALGKQLGRARFQDWCEKERSGSIPL